MAHEFADMSGCHMLKVVCCMSRIVTGPTPGESAESMSEYESESESMPNVRRTWSFILSKNDWNGGGSIRFI